jgi:hypothetical protein
MAPPAQCFPICVSFQGSNKCPVLVLLRSLPAVVVYLRPFTSSYKAPRPCLLSCRHHSSGIDPSSGRAGTRTGLNQSSLFLCATIVFRAGPDPMLFARQPFGEYSKHDHWAHSVADIEPRNHRRYDKGNRRNEQGKARYAYSKYVLQFRSCQNIFHSCQSNQSRRSIGRQI